MATVSALTKPKHTRDAYDGVNSDLLIGIPEDAKIVLDIGCGTGALGYAYKAKNPKCKYIGVEVEPQIAAEAKHNLDSVVVGNIEGLKFSDLPLKNNEKIDCIVYGNVLEYLVDPWQAIRNHKEWLKPGGKIIATIPNMQCWTVIMDILTAQWKYPNNDRNALRTFTFEGVKELFKTDGLALDNIIVRKTTPYHNGMDKEAFMKLAEPLIKGLSINLEMYEKISKAPYLVALATKK